MFSFDSPKVNDVIQNAILTEIDRLDKNKIREYAINLKLGEKDYCEQIMRLVLAQVPQQVGCSLQQPLVGKCVKNLEEWHLLLAKKLQLSLLRLF